MGEKKKGMGMFGVWLKVALVQCGMMQKDLAKLMNTSEACISRWIHGGRIPCNKQLTWILDYFDCHNMRETKCPMCGRTVKCEWTGRRLTVLSCVRTENRA